MRDARGRSPSPRRVGNAIAAVRRSIEPETGLARIETVWAEAVGEGIAAVARPVSERDGVLTVECESAVWAQELDLIEGKIRQRLVDALGDTGPSRIRFRS